MKARLTKAEKREKKRRITMKVSGRGVIRLAQFIAKKAKVDPDSRISTSHPIKTG